jgi:hypothetical protein
MHMPRIPTPAPAWKFRRFAVLLLASAATAGCHLGHTGGWVAPEPVYVTIVNENTLDMDIYAVHSSMRIRLGTVTSTSTRHFVLKPTQLGGDGTFQLYADPIGSNRGVYSDQLYLTGGQVAEWTLASVLQQSTIMVRDST